MRSPVLLICGEGPCVLGLEGRGALCCWFVWGGAEATLGKSFEHWKLELEGPTVTSRNRYCHLP